MAKTVQTDCWWPTRSYSSWKSFHTFAVLGAMVNNVRYADGECYSLVPRARDDGAVFGGMERTDVVCVSEEGEVGFSVGGREREDIDNRILTSRDRVACASRLARNREGRAYHRGTNETTHLLEHRARVEGTPLRSRNGSRHGGWMLGRMRGR